MSRRQMLASMALYEALAAAYKAALKAEPERRYVEEGTVMSEKVPGIGSLGAALSQDTTTVTDEEKFMDWVEANYPTEVVTETKVIRTVRNPAWRDQMLANLQAVDPDELQPGEGTQCMDNQGTVIPGVARFAGGRYLYASVAIDSALKRRLAAAASAHVERGEPMPAIAGSTAQVIEGSVTDDDPV